MRQKALPDEQRDRVLKASSKLATVYTMRDELAGLWHLVQADDDVPAMVKIAAVVTFALVVVVMAYGRFLPWLE